MDAEKVFCSTCNHRETVYAGFSGSDRYNTGRCGHPDAEYTIDTAWERTSAYAMCETRNAGNDCKDYVPEPPPKPGFIARLLQRKEKS